MATQRRHVEARTFKASLVKAGMERHGCAWSGESGLGVAGMDNETVGDKLKRLRQESGLSQAQAADLARVSQRAWARFEAGSKEAPPGLVELFCIKAGRDYIEQFGRAA